MRIDRSVSFALLSLIGCGMLAVGAEQTRKSAIPIARMGSTVLTEEEMRKELGVTLYQVESQLYQVKKNWVDQKVKTVLFDQAAKDAGLGRQAWEMREIDAKASQPTQQEIDQLASQSAAVQTSTTPPSQAEIAAIREQVRQYVTFQKRALRESAVFQELVQKTPLDLLFTRPELPDVVVTYGKDSPVKGPEDAAVTIIEFADFECGACKRAQESVKAVERAYGGKIKLVDRMFPLTDMHPRAMPSAEAAFCAKEQGKYWEMRDRLFASRTMTDNDFQRYAKDLNLDLARFGKCLAEHKYSARIEADMADGKRFGVTGTPAFFVDGLQTSFPHLEETVRNELEKKKAD